MSVTPEIHERAAQPYVSIRSRVKPDGLPAAVDRGFPAVFGWLAERDLAPAGPPFIRYLVVDAGSAFEIDVAVPVAAAPEGTGQVTVDALPAGRYATLLHVGPFTGSSAATRRCAHGDVSRTSPGICARARMESAGAARSSATWSIRPPSPTRPSGRPRWRTCSLEAWGREYARAAGSLERMRIAFASTRGAGHLGPLVPLGRACVRAGHEVLVLAPEEAAHVARRAGLPFRAVGAPPAAVRERAWASVWSAETSPGAEHVVRELFTRLQARAALPRMLAAIEEWAPDVLVRETLEFASSAAAERLGVPEVQFGIHLSSHWDAGALGLAAPALDELRVAAGLAPDPTVRSARRAPLLTLAPASLGPPLPAVRRYRDPDAPSPDRRDEPLIYVSFGSEAAATGRYFPGLYRAVAEALGALGTPILLTVGARQDPAELGPLPSSARAERWVAQAEVMPRATAMVGHGGSGSTLMALAAGVPLALMPLFADGHGNAERVADAGAGIALDGVDGVADAVRALLEDRRHRRAAARIAAEIRAQPPIDEAVGILERLADDRLAASGRDQAAADRVAGDVDAVAHARASRGCSRDGGRRSCG